MNKTIAVALVTAIYSFCLAPAAYSQPTSKLRTAIGTNLAQATYYSSQLPFVDVMKSSMEWVSGDSLTWNNGQPLDLDVNGWVRSLAPGQYARTLMLRSIGDHYPAGQYLVRYKGQGTLKFQFSATVVSQKQGEIVLQVTPADSGIHMYITATNPADYVRDIEVTMPGGICEGDPFTHAPSAQACGAKPFLSYADNAKSILFYPVFLERLRAYSVLRFMDWMQTNNSTVSNWAQRPLLTYQTWAGRNGVPIEVMIALANRLNARPWFTLPLQSDDTYAQNFAQLIKANLNSALRVYVEHSNEVWNGQFAQYKQAVQQAAAQTPPIDNLQYHALRTRTLGGIFDNALGSKRVVTVLGAQAASLYTAVHGLDYLKSRFGAAIRIDAVAIAPYMGVTPDPQTAGIYTAMTPDALFAYVRNSVLPAVVSMERNYRNAVNSYGLQLVAYEGGQHLVGIYGAENNATLSAMFYAFNRDPRIKQLYLDYFAAWKVAGGQLFVHFNDTGLYSKWGSWGSLEYIDEPRAAAPKFDGIQTFIETNPVWWVQ